MKSISDIITHLDITQKGKSRKNAERLYLIERLSTITGWAKKSIYFQTIKFPDKWLRDIIEYCEHYSSPALRNKKLKEFIELSKSS
jgi:hypothetical protein